MFLAAFLEKVLTSLKKIRMSLRKLQTISVGLVAFVCFFIHMTRPRAAIHPTESAVLAPQPGFAVTPEMIAAALKLPLSAGRFPDQVEFSSGTTLHQAKFDYTVDWQSHEAIESLFRAYRPDYAAFVAMDAKTGRILSLISYTRSPTTLGNLALRALFPAASVFKVVTAAAALDEHKVEPDTIITFNGSNHTLYKRNVTSQTPSRWARHMSLKEAFAKSVNTVFGRLGVYLLHPDALSDYAQRFIFNQSIPTDVPVEEGQFALPDSDAWGIAEAASGYNRIVQMSPLQGALIAAAAANDGVIMDPYLVESVSAPDVGELYHAEPKTLSVPISSETAAKLRALMRETVAEGTSRRSFRPLYRRAEFADIEIGGKTGSLEGEHPHGRTEWFVGYALTKNERIAVAALTISENKWRIKPSDIARHYFENYFQAELKPHRRHSDRARQTGARRAFSHSVARG